jgi:hypothetical protein
MLTRVVRTFGLCVIALITSSIDARAQAEVTRHLRGPEPQSLGHLRLPLLPPVDVASGGATPAVSTAPAPPVQPHASLRSCRRGRRALIGALIGTAGAVPLAVVARNHWENEAANGAAAAATALALGAAAGAFVGLATCD